jgi:bifunctional ADP-heptose synthase (sugar kinase/adenylyltransferase)
LDTRSKIVTLERALELSSRVRTAFVSGYFDPVTAEHARRLRERKAGHDVLVAAISNPSDPVLDERARAEVLAALEMVDYVVLPREGVACLPAGTEPNVSVFREETADEERLQRLVERVHQKHGLPASR